MKRASTGSGRRRLTRIPALGCLVLVSLAVLIPVAIGIVLGAIGFITYVGPGRHVAIAYPHDGAEVPTDFNLVSGSAFWLFGVVDHSPGLVWGSSKLSLATYGVKGDLSVDGKRVLRSKESGKTHVFRVRVDEGPHTLTFSTLLGSAAIRVVARAEPSPGFEEISYPRVEHRYAVGPSVETGECCPNIRLDETRLYLSLRARRVEYMLSELSVIRKRYQKLRAQTSRRSFPRLTDYQVKLCKCFGNYSVSWVTATLAAVRESRYTRIPSLTHDFLVVVDPSDVSLVEFPPSRGTAPPQDFVVFVSEDGTLVWIERFWWEDVAFSDVAYVWDKWDKAARRWDSGHNPGILRERAVQENGNCTTTIEIAGGVVSVTGEGRTNQYRLAGLPEKKEGVPLVESSMRGTPSLSCSGRYAAQKLVAVHEQAGRRVVVPFLLHSNGAELRGVEVPRKGSSLEQELGYAVTGKGSMVVADEINRVGYWDGRAWKGLSVPIVPADPIEAVLSTPCGSASYNRSRAGFFSMSSAAFAPCPPRVNLFVFRGEAFLESSSRSGLFKRRLFRLRE